MLTATIISFREFLEVFLIVGVFFGISRKLKIKKEFEIVVAAVLGIVFSFLLAVGVFSYGDLARGVLTEKNTEILESYLMIFSGFFLAYVVFSLHGIIRRGQGETIIRAHNKLQNNAFDTGLFFTIIFLIIREGFEIALFTASTTLFSSFMQNIIGLFFGFTLATIIGLLVYFAYISFPIGKVCRATEYIIMILGASQVQNGLTGFFKYGLNIELTKILSLPLNFLPAENTVPGHFIKSFFGLDQEFSLVKLAIMITYLAIIYLLFIKQKIAKRLF
jgi:FTR1 family protein